MTEPVPPASSAPSDASPNGAERATRRSRRRALVAAGVLVIAVVASVMVTQATMSPAEHAAQRSAVTPVPVVVQPRRQVLRDVRIGECTVSAQQSDVVSPGSGATAAVLTAVDATTGEPLVSGERVVEISGRPVIALNLPFPLYRDLKPLDTGPDVQAAQEALISLGRLQGDPSGTFDRSTQGAVEQLYQDVGAKAPVTGAEVDSAIDAAEATEQALQVRIDAGEEVDSGELADAADAKRQAVARRGVVLPRAEIVAVPADTVVNSVAIDVGASAAEGTVIATIRGLSSTADGTFTSAGASGIGPGQRATLQAGGQQHIGTLGAVSIAAGEAKATFAADGEPLDGALSDTTATVEVIVAESAEVLSVPAGVLREATSGGVAVNALASDGTVRTIAVSTGMTAGGWVQITEGDVTVETELIVRQAAEPR